MAVTGSLAHARGARYAARMTALLGPTSHYFYSQRLKLHYVDWGNADKPPLLLIHGGRDHARNWDWVAQDLRRDYHIIAPDLRGHGDSQWAIGGSYAMVDYTLDVAQLLDALGIEPITIIGHSLGGSIALQYTGTYPGPGARRSSRSKASVRRPSCCASSRRRTSACACGSARCRRWRAATRTATRASTRRSRACATPTRT